MPLSERNGGLGTGRRREGEVGGNLFIVKSNRRHSAHLLAAAPSLPMSTSSSSSSSSSTWSHHYCYCHDDSHHNLQGGHEYTATDQAPSAWPKLNQWQKLQTNLGSTSFKSDLKSNLLVGNTAVLTLHPTHFAEQGRQVTNLLHPLHCRQVAKLQSCKVAKLQSCKHANLQTCKLANLQSCKVANLQSCTPPSWRGLLSASWWCWALRCGDGWGPPCSRSFTRSRSFSRSRSYSSSRHSADG